MTPLASARTSDSSALKDAKMGFQALCILRNNVNKYLTHRMLCVII